VANEKKEAIQALSNASFVYDPALNNLNIDGHCKVRDCTCGAFVWRLLSFPKCGRDGCGHDVTEHDVI